MSWKRYYRAPRIAVMAGAVTLLGAGCAHQADSKGPTESERNLVLQQRLEDSERTNSRLTVRIEELEDAVFLLQDRVEANRISLQRKGYMRSIAQSPQAPTPVPESYYPGSQGYYPAPHQQAQPQPQRNVTRIPMGSEQEIYGNTYYPQPQQQQQQVPTSGYPTQNGDAELVITDDDFREFAGEPKQAPTKRSSSSSTGKSAQPDVTSERLATTDELKDGTAPQPKPKAEAPAPAEAPRKVIAQSSKEKLELYKTALADYRAGNYAQALSGFEGFLSAGPRADYVDNALYWIGECHFGLDDFDSAVSYFQRVISEQPDGNKVPDAMLKMSLAYDRVGRGNDATRLLETLTKNYPATNAGQLGVKRLQERAE